MNPDQTPDLLNNSYYPESYQLERPIGPCDTVSKKVLEAITGLVEVSKKEGLDLHSITKLFVALPLKEDGTMNDLEEVGQCIVIAQDLIENSYPALSDVQRLVKEYCLMGSLFQLKAQQLKG